MSARHVVILGLRRSGTTVFWQAFRRDASFVAFNEPFNPTLRELPEELPNGSRAELIAMLREDPAGFWRRFAVISRTEELQEGLTDRQREWLRTLLDRDRPAVLDTTRCHFKIEALRETAPDAVLVHLVRSPAAVASSHLIPSGSGGFRAAAWRKRLASRDVFTRRAGYNHWGVEELVGRSPEGLFGLRCREAGLDPQRVYALPAVARLLAWWKINSDRADEDGPRHFGEDFVRIRFEDFCADPVEALRPVYARLERPLPEGEAPRVHAPNPAHRAGDPRWAELFAELGIREPVR